MNLLDFGFEIDTKIEFLLYEDDICYQIANDYKVVESGMISSGKGMTTRKDFEERVKKTYLTSNIRWISKEEFEKLENEKWGEIQ